MEFVGAAPHKFPALCLVCGPTTISLDLPIEGVDSLILEDTIHQCDKCGGKIYVSRAHYSFLREAASEVRTLNITKRSARRFVNKSKRVVDPALFLETIDRTQPEFHPLTRKIRQEKDLGVAIALAALAVTIVFGLPGAIADWTDFLSSTEQIELEDSLDLSKPENNNYGNEKPKNTTEDDPSKDAFESPDKIPKKNSK
jgi:hypothetical protein